MKQKIFFWIDADITSFCIPYYLQKISDAEFYTMIDITNKPKKFFKEQKLIEFKKIWFLHEQIQNSTNFSIENLKNYENKYDLNLWELLTNERIFYKYNQFYNFEKNTLLSIDYQILEFFENILNSISPDVLLTIYFVINHAVDFKKIRLNF